MQRIRTVLRTIFFIIVFLLGHYVLPQHDIVRVTSTEIIRADFSWYNRSFYAQADSGAEDMPSRDLRLINTEKKRTWLLGFIQRDATEIMVYRNEDTGWIWPPYFKFDSSDLQAEAAAEISAAGSEQWVVMTHYGWRNRFLTVYPNAIGIQKVDGPDARVIPWFNIIFIGFVIFAYFFIRAVWRQFVQRKVTPVVDDMGAAYDRVEDNASQAKGRFSRWIDTWRSKPRR